MTIAELHKEFIASAGICTDTRLDVRHRLFFALKGEHFDGNKYVKAALKLGCHLAITEDKVYEGEAGILYTPSSLSLLQELAAYHRKQADPRVLAITGSNGKTTTKELVSAVLSKSFSVLATKGNLNNHIGVPLTLLSLEGEEFAVIEMGANHPGEIASLALIAAPDLGLITNVGKAHLEGFGSLSGVLDAKAELYEFLASTGGKAIVDGEDNVLLDKASSIGVRVLPVGEDGALPVSIKLLDQSPFLEIELKIGAEVYRVKTALVGAYNLQNIKLAAACGHHFGIAGEDIADAIASYTPDNQRSQVVEGRSNRLILDSYNANPSSMREAVSGLIAYSGKPPMVILGDMAELGPGSLEEHSELCSWIGTLPLDQVLLLGPLFSEVSEPSGGSLVFRDMDALWSYLENNPPLGKTILIKGSRVMGMERLKVLLA